MKTNFDTSKMRLLYVTDYGQKITQAEDLLSHVASMDSTWLYFKNPGEDPIPIKHGCKLIYVHLDSLGEADALT